MYSKVDLENWSRKELYKMFKDYEDPFFNVTANVDVTKLFKHCKTVNESFFLSTLFCSMKAVNSIDNFKMRIIDDEVVLYETIHCGCSVLHKDQSFTFCYFHYYENRNDFLKEGQKSLDEHLANPFLDAKLGDLAMIHHSTLPWIHFTQFKHARRGKGYKDSIPKITFGKAQEKDNGKFEMPISVEVNHALMDGLHLGLFFEKIQEVFESSAIIK